MEVAPSMFDMYLKISADIQPPSSLNHLTIHLHRMHIFRLHLVPRLFCLLNELLWAHFLWLWWECITSLAAAYVIKHPVMSAVVIPALCTYFALINSGSDHCPTRVTHLLVSRHDEMECVMCSPQTLWSEYAPAATGAVLCFVLFLLLTLLNI